MEKKMYDIEAPKIENPYKYAGPSIIELIEAEIEASAGSGYYREGLIAALRTIERANANGQKPFYQLKTELGKAQAQGNSQFTHGVRTAIFIFNTPYKWLAGKRP